MNRAIRDIAEKSISTILYFREIVIIEIATRTELKEKIRTNY